MYTIHTKFGTITRDVDNKIIAPCQSLNDPDFIAYQEWHNAGNELSVDETEPYENLVPNEISASQIRRALTMIGKRDIVETAVLQASQDIKDEWQYSTVFHRNNPILDTFATALGINIDEVFFIADTL